MSKRNRKYRHLKEGTRAYRRALDNPHLRKKCLKTIFSIFDEDASDRASYVEKFFKLWDGATTAVDNAAEEILKYRICNLEKNVWEGLLDPYVAIQIFHFSRLMDRLEPDEEARYVETLTRLNCAWQKFFAFTLARHPALQGTIERMEENRRILQEEVADLFTGEAAPILTLRWANALTALQDDFKPLSEGLMK